MSKLCDYLWRIADNLHFKQYNIIRVIVDGETTDVSFPTEFAQTVSKVYDSNYNSGYSYLIDYADEFENKFKTSLQSREEDNVMRHVLLLLELFKPETPNNLRQ